MVALYMGILTLEYSVGAYLKKQNQNFNWVWYIYHPHNLKNIIHFLIAYFMSFSFELVPYWPVFVARDGVKYDLIMWRRVGISHSNNFTLLVQY